MTLNIPYDKFNHTMIRFCQSSSRKFKDQTNKDYFKILYSTPHTTITGISILIEIDKHITPQKITNILSTLQEIEHNIYNDFLDYMSLSKTFSKVSLHKTQLRDTIAAMITNVNGFLIVRISGIHWSFSQPILHFFVS